MTNTNAKAGKLSGDQSKNWWESQGFFVALIALMGAFWGLSEDTATSVVTAVTGLISAGALVLQFFKTSKFQSFKDVLSNSNTWAYLVTVIGSFLPNAGEIVAALRGVSDAAFSKNLGAILTALFTFGVMLYNIVVKKK